MEIQNASIIDSKSYQLKNVNTIRWESKNINPQPEEIGDRKSEIVFVANPGMNTVANNFYI